MKKLLVVLAIMALAVSAQAQNLLQNASFDQAVGSSIPSWTAVGLGPSYTTVFEANTALPGRVGAYAAQHIAWGGAGDAGYIYQQVSGVAVGSVLTAFSKYVWYTGGGESAGGFPVGIGIDPTGGTDWTAASVAKLEIPPAVKGSWSSFQLENVVAQSSTVTMFLYSSGEAISPNWWAHGFDEASLTATAVPEPGSILALCSGLIGLVGLRRRK